MKNVLLPFALLIFCVAFMSPSQAKADHAVGGGYGGYYQPYYPDYMYGYSRHSSYGYNYNYGFRPYCGGYLYGDCYAPVRKAGRFLGRAGFFAVRGVFGAGRFAIRGAVRTGRGVVRFAMFGRRFH